MKTVNLGVYEIYKRNEANSMYDILICKSCNFSCLRNNFPRHKLSKTHIKKNTINAEIIDNSIVEKTPDTATVIDVGRLEWEVMAV